VKQLVKTKPCFLLILAQMIIRVHSIFLMTFLFLLTGCANQTTPTGGKKDITPPKLLTVTPVDSLRNTKVKKLELVFDEYITANDVSKEVQISPLLAIQPSVIGYGKKVTVKIVDSLLEDNTTYRISFGTSIRDLHESNVFKNYTYTFSTGAYFDSMSLGGRVLNAGTGLPDTSGIVVVLYNVNENDSAIVRHKPKYITRADANGRFAFKGLPNRDFKIYALKDANDNMLYDKGADMVAFNEMPAVPGDTSGKELVLRLFEEAADSGTKPQGFEAGRKDKGGLRTGNTENNVTDKKGAFSCSVVVDTGTPTKRTFDITRPLAINFNAIPFINKDKINLSYDSNGVQVAQLISITIDTSIKQVVNIKTDWKENTLYTLRLAKGFAKDSSGTEVLPSKYIFRTKEDEDYGKITVHLPSKYYRAGYVLQVVADKDTIYQKPIADTMVALTKLRPSKYQFRVIADKNGNGKWDTGNLFLKIQPEEVTPYLGDLFLKPGWENTVDFEVNPKAKR
jgi:hypothetical protein